MKFEKKKLWKEIKNQAHSTKFIKFGNILMCVTKKKKLFTDVNLSKICIYSRIEIKKDLHKTGLYAAAFHCNRTRLPSVAF